MPRQVASGGMPTPVGGIQGRSPEQINKWMRERARRKAQYAKENIHLTPIKLTANDPIHFPGVDPLDDLRREVTAEIAILRANATPPRVAPTTSIALPTRTFPPPGKVRQIPKGRIYQLLEHMWDRDVASYDTILDQVLKSELAPQTIRSLASKASVTLVKIGETWGLSVDSVARVITKVITKRKKPRIPKKGFTVN